MYSHNEKGSHCLFMTAQFSKSLNCQVVVEEPTVNIFFDMLVYSHNEIHSILCCSKSVATGALGDLHHFTSMMHWLEWQLCQSYLSSG